MPIPFFYFLQKPKKNRFSREVDVDYMGLAPKTGP